MSVQAITWVLEEAPDVPAHLVSTLVALANHADRTGRGCYPSQEVMAWYTRKSDRSIRNDLKQLIASNLIRRGDQRLVAHIPADERPVVYDLAVERKRTDARPGKRDRKLTSGRTDGGSGSPLPAHSKKGPEAGFRAEAHYRPEAHFQRDRKSTSEGTGSPLPTNRPRTVLEPLPPQHPAARIAAALGLEEEEAEKVWNHIHTERQPKAPSRYITTLIANGDLRAIADQVLGTGPTTSKPSPFAGRPTHDFEAADTDPTGDTCIHCPLPPSAVVHRRLRVAGD